MHVSVAIARAVISEVERRGHCIDHLLQRAELPLSLFDDPRGELSIHDFERLILATLDRIDSPDAGFAAGYNAPAGAAHLVGFVMVNSRTLRDALQLFERYAELVVEGASWHLVENGDEARFGFEHPSLSSSAARFASELIMGFLVARLRSQFFGPEGEVRELRMRASEPLGGPAIRRLLDISVIWGCERDELVFDREALDVSQRHSDPWVCQMLCDKAERLLGERQSEERLRLRVKDSFKYHVQLGRPDSETVATSLGLSTRTLRRRLSKLGYSFRELVDEARQELACDALARPESSIKEVAYTLGFAEPSAFHRAFKRWMGITPREFQMQAGALA